MLKKYDIIVVGAGPAGLMASIVAAQNGLSVALLERKTDIAAIKRSCASMFAIEDDYFFGERMFFHAAQGKMVFPVNGFSVPYDGPYKNFYGQILHAPNGENSIKIGDYDENIKKLDKGRLSVVFDKEHLLRSMLSEASSAGVDIINNQNVTGVKKHNGCLMVSADSGQTWEGTFVVAADGINSRMAQSCGFNQDRILYGTVKTVSRTMTGVAHPSPLSYQMTTYFEKRHGVPITCGLVPRAVGDDTFWFFIGGPRDSRIDYLCEIDQFQHDSPFSAWFTDASCIDQHCALLNFWSPIEDPFRDNVLVISDAAWSIEAECTGAIMCGWKAAQAITIAFRDAQPDRQGVGTYLEWWKKSFLSYDYKGYLKSLAMFYVLSESDISYVFSLLDRPLPCTLNPHKLQGLMGMAIMEQLPKIQAERPDILAKFQELESRPLDELLAPLKV